MPAAANTTDTPDPRQIAEDTCRALLGAHAGIGADVVTAVVLQAAEELVGRARPPEEFRRMLHRRASARLAAMAGVLTPITSG
ncbi:hypothetical protein [Actinokineospora globicatena]|uniref:hypothetical protein n=1 Tax=Actinokineospora globicatena TaxID=103729 RepID=UPI0020A488AC|nr:hypothetical protein [Actinokineospora globicatena]MCP2306405.1 hypothetical protein [Actinokineospora globicatena]GLW81831.1 hypothetical protein Aglo01_63120 [Actinokineospora globicatena]GLW88625.1 hypothetical protein Aglo02_62640 [Actinokineospora globicatena]